jgi:hypothetical protein
VTTVGTAIQYQGHTIPQPPMNTWTTVQIVLDTAAKQLSVSTDGAPVLTGDPITPFFPAGCDAGCSMAFSTAVGLNDVPAPAQPMNIHDDDILVESLLAEEPPGTGSPPGHSIGRADALPSSARGPPMPDDNMKAELERLRAENEQLKKRPERTTSLKVSEKGGVSVYGLGRFPVTLYKEQWGKLLDMADEIRAFIKENEAKLKTKGDE